MEWIALAVAGVAAVVALVALLIACDAGSNADSLRAMIERDER